MSDFQVGDVVRYVVDDELRDSVWSVVRVHHHNTAWILLADPVFVPAPYTNARRIPLLTAKLEKIPNAK